MLPYIRFIHSQSRIPVKPFQFHFLHPMFHTVSKVVIRAALVSQLNSDSDVGWPGVVFKNIDNHEIEVCPEGAYYVYYLERLMYRIRITGSTGWSIFSVDTCYMLRHKILKSKFTRPAKFSFSLGIR